MTVSYEWDLETVDLESGDIIDHWHADRLANIRKSETVEPDKQLVLVRDVGSEDEGLVDRLWAYLGENGNLPEVFADSLGAPTQYTVPKRFHRELASYRAGR